jgi:hypothetical protein
VLVLVVLGGIVLLEAELTEPDVDFDDTELTVLELGFEGTELEVGDLDEVGLTVLELVLEPVELAVLEAEEEEDLLMGQDPSRFEFPVQGIQSS